MTTSTVVHVTRDENVPTPFRPVPEIIGNDEGNERILEHDRDAAARFLEKQRAKADRAKR